MSDLLPAGNRGGCAPDSPALLSAWSVQGSFSLCATFRLVAMVFSRLRMDCGGVR